MLEPLLKGGPPDLKLLNLVGLAYTGKGDLGHADAYFKRALSIKADFVPALKNLAINELSLGETETAGKHLALALRQAPEDPVIKLYLGQICYEQGDFHQAAQYLSRAAVGPMRNSKVLAMLAISDLKMGQPDQAPLAELPPEALEARSQFSLGVALIEAGFAYRAVPYLEALDRAYPGSVDLGYDLAICYLSARQYPQAIAVLTALVAQGHESSEIDNLSAEAYEGNQQTQPAVDALRRAIALDPSNEDNYLDFATLCINHQSFSQAAQVLSVGLAAHPRSGRLTFERGILNAMQDHFDQAEKDFAQAAALAPQDQSGNIGLGIAYLETGNTAQAISLLRKQTKEHPSDPHLAFLLGESFIRSGVQPGQPQFAEAQAALETSVRIDANLSEPRAALGSLYLETGRVQEAVQQLEKARTLDPKSKSAYSHLAIAYRRLAEPDKAREAIAHLQQINVEEREGLRKHLKVEDSDSKLPAPGTVR